MRYCQHCILPNTRPHLDILDDGICIACHNSFIKAQQIDWIHRQNEFIKLVENVKKKKSPWDCVIPVSGGKDSTWQVVKALEYNLKPLCITWRTPARTKIGQVNLENLINLGVDHIDFTINPVTEKKFTKLSLEKMGSVAIPMHMALFAIPLQMATKYKIPLVIWGENSAIEYGGSNKDLLGHQMTSEWLLSYGVTQGTTAKDWICPELTLSEMQSYIWPSDEELSAAGTSALFLGWYFKWDPTETYKVSKQYGFKESEAPPQTGYYNFADIDDNFIIPVHHWLKWYKFGFTRLWDNLSLEIRNKRITREEAISIIRDVGEEYPENAINKLCSWMDISQEQFQQIIEKFRNKNIWKYGAGHWYIPEFLIDEWQWDNHNAVCMR